MRRRIESQGAILNIVAGAGRGADRGAYLSSMAGLAALSDQADLELSPHGIRVAAIENSVKDVMSTLEAWRRNEGTA